MQIQSYFVDLFQTGQVLGRVNLVTGHVKTQLIAHDKEVYDIAFSRAGGGRDMFASVGKEYSDHMPCFMVQIMFSGSHFRLKFKFK